MHSTAHPCWFCMKECAECRCQAVIEHWCQSWGSLRRRVRYQYCCGRSPTLGALIVVSVVITRQTRTPELYQTQFGQLLLTQKNTADIILRQNKRNNSTPFLRHYHPNRQFFFLPLMMLLASNKKDAFYNY